MRPPTDAGRAAGRAQSTTRRQANAATRRGRCQDSSKAPHHRAQAERPCRRLQGLLASAQALKRGPEARKVFCQRILPDCACDPFDGEIAVACLKRQQSHQVKRVGAVWIYRERLLAIDQRIEISPGPQVMKTCFIQRRRAACVDAVRSRPGFCGRRPAFAAVHLRTPKVVKRPWLADSGHAAKVVLLIDSSLHERLGGADVIGYAHLDRGLPVPPKGIVMEDGKRKPARQFRSME
jgi:hypothetical protein